MLWGCKESWRIWEGHYIQVEIKGSLKPGMFASFRFAIFFLPISDIKSQSSKYKKKKTPTLSI